MRKFLIGLVAMGVIAAACGSNNDTGAGATGSSGPTGATSSPTAAQTAADCVQSVTLTTPGSLTVGTDNRPRTSWCAALHSGKSRRSGPVGRRETGTRTGRDRDMLPECD